MNGKNDIQQLLNSGPIWKWIKTISKISLLYACISTPPDRIFTASRVFGICYFYHGTKGRCTKEKRETKCRLCHSTQSKSISLLRKSWAWAPTLDRCNVPLREIWYFPLSINSRNNNDSMEKRRFQYNGCAIRSSWRFHLSDAMTHHGIE